jgi:hypothetical protein
MARAEQAPDAAYLNSPWRRVTVPTTSLATALTLPRHLHTPWVLRLRSTRVHGSIQADSNKAYSVIQAVKLQHARTTALSLPVQLIDNARAAA